MGCRDTLAGDIDCCWWRMLEESSEAWTGRRKFTEKTEQKEEKAVTFSGSFPACVRASGDRYYIIIKMFRNKKL